MNKKFFIAWPIIFVVWMLGSFIVHGVLLHDDYGKLPQLFRPEAESQQYFPLMILAHVMLAGAFAWIYARATPASDWLPQGLRFGLAAALLTTAPTYTIYYVVQPMPGLVVMKQIIFDSILIVILSVIAAYLYQQPAK